ncbi:MAG: class I SAM-dependent methyltransferase [Nitrospiraceae bacterium]|nr:class I SAM-dependent methyltransferase [Nitrospiraceae bacterium]
MAHDDIEPAGTYRPQFQFKWRRVVRLLDPFPGLKEFIASRVRGLLRRCFEPGMVTTERVVEYPFVFQHLSGVTGPILDLGCCHSRLPIALASRGYQVVGMDFNPYPYAHPGLRSIRGDIMQIPFADRTFSAVLAVSVIEHIGIGHYGEPEANVGDQVAVQEVARILKPGGKALISVPYGRRLTNDWMRVYDQARLRKLIAPLSIERIEYAVSRAGLWMPSTEVDAAAIDWTGTQRSVALVVGAKAA